VLPAQLCGATDLLDLGALVHGVEHSLRARLSPEGQPAAADLLQQPDHLLIYQVYARQRLERDDRVTGEQRIVPFLEPMAVYPQHVVHDADLVGMVTFFDLPHLLGDRLGAAHPVGAAEDALLAPGAPVRAAAPRDHGEG